ncbi:hypothetical protein L1049_017919 [Liquidambar formosana]|uniref:Uncharacterized protein n=1 Tax=Liquidambar formosana TaxID=63359 RepID=A0AAP0NK07_LIQFO
MERAFQPRTKWPGLLTSLGNGLFSENYSENSVRNALPCTFLGLWLEFNGLPNCGEHATSPYACMRHWNQVSLHMFFTVCIMKKKEEDEKQRGNKSQGWCHGGWHFYYEE